MPLKPRLLDPSVMVLHCWTVLGRHATQCSTCKRSPEGLLCAVCNIVHDSEHPNVCTRCRASLWLVPSVHPCKTGDYHLLRLARELRREQGKQLRLLTGAL
jgi:hypothetical protein